MRPTPPRVGVVGAGLAGCECALALAAHGVACVLFEMKPERFSPAHESADLGELVCSNSLRSDDPDAAVGVLKREMEALGSAVLAAARATALPAGSALAVDRERFSRALTERVQAEELIELKRQEIHALDDPALEAFERVVVAAGPLASEDLSQSLTQAVGATHLYFYDAIAPIVATDSVDQEIAFWGSRYAPEEKDYLNCPMNEAEYAAFYEALTTARAVPSKDFEKELHFEGCMPIEAMAARGPETLTFGPFKPVGFTDPRTGERPHAIVQLRAENEDRSAMNLVGCQTKLAHGEQPRVFRMIPGLENAEFLRLGSVHRNTYVNAPRCLNADLSLTSAPAVHLAGQITGVEGYVESAASGLYLGHLLGRLLTGGEPLAAPPETTALGGLLAHLAREVKNFQPSNVNFGLTPGLNMRLKKKDRKAAYARRAREAFAAWLAGIPPLPETPAA